MNKRVNCWQSQDCISQAMPAHCLLTSVMWRIRRCVVTDQYPGNLGLWEHLASGVYRCIYAVIGEGHGKYKQSNLNNDDVITTPTRRDTCAYRKE